MMRAIRIIGSICFAAFILNNSLWAKCTITDGATLVIRAAVGDLLVDTTARDSSVEAQVNSNEIQIRETCRKDVVELTNSETDQTHGQIIWKVTAPRAV